MPFLKMLFQYLTIPRQNDECLVIDALDLVTKCVLEQNNSVIPQTDRVAVNSANTIDLQWLTDRTSAQWTSVGTKSNFRTNTNTNSIRFLKMKRIRIRIVFILKIKTNTNTNSAIRS